MGQRVQYLVKWFVSIHFTTVNNSSVQLGKYPFVNVRVALLSRTLSLGDNLHDFIFCLLKYLLINQIILQVLF
jgi:hypothetical protein